MPSLWIKSGTTGVPPQNVPINTATAETFDLVFPVILVQILTAFKSHLALTAIFPKLVPTPSDSNFCCVEWAGESIARGNDLATFEINFYLEKTRADQDYGGTQTDIAYTVSALKRLLLANQNFRQLAGLHQIEALEIVTGSFYQSLVSEEAEVDGALLTVRWSRYNPLPEADI